MSIRAYGILAGTAALMAWGLTQPAQALSEHECSQKYHAAKSAGTLGGMSWNQFRKAECSADAAPADTTTTTTTTAPAQTAAPSGHGLTMHECSQKYQAAKSADALGGMSWNQFREAECSASAAAAGAAAAAAAAAPGASGGTASSSVAIGNAVFPRAVSPNFASQSPGEARMHTCLQQYKANKARNQNGGLEWIQRGGGYWSQCDHVLKSASQ